MRLTALVLGIIATSASTAWAQIPGVDLILAPRIGAFVPMSDLSDDQGGTSKIKSGLGLGVSVELDIPASPINLRANLDAALDRDVEIDGTTGELKADIVNLTGDLVFRPLPRVVVLQPYLLAGGGVKRLTLKAAEFDVSDTESDFTGHVGVGLDLKVPGFGVVAEVSDYISSYESGGEKKLQNDVFVMVGLRIGLF